MSDLWIGLAQRAGLTLSPEQVARLERYLELLLQANERMNLTRITDREAARTGHVADALTLLPHLPAAGKALADVGSGGGVPGIPLAIVRPDLAITLIESTRKKAEFLRQAAADLGLDSLTVVPQRAEEAGAGPLRETFDVAVARAVTTLDWLAEWCLPLVRPGGVMLAMKGPRHAEELPAAAKAIHLTGGGQPQVHPAGLVAADGHVIIAVPKLHRTDPRYPRPAPRAKGRPLA